MMPPVETVWWLRPVIKAARVGEQSAVVWNWLYRNPDLASRLNVGVGIGPPKVLLAPNPTSSVKISNTLGAPWGAWISSGKSLTDSAGVSTIFPRNSGCAMGMLQSFTTPIAVSQSYRYAMQLRRFSLQLEESPHALGTVLQIATALNREPIRRGGLAAGLKTANFSARARG